MLKKNMEDLSKLAFMQEAKKNFEDGVPLASHPFLMSKLRVILLIKKMNCKNIIHFFIH